MDPFFDGTEMEIGLSQEYPVSEVKMEMVVCRNLRLPEPGEDEATQRRQQRHESDDEVIDREDEGEHLMEMEGCCEEEELNINGDVSPMVSGRIEDANSVSNILSQPLVEGDQNGLDM